MAAFSPKNLIKVVFNTSFLFLILLLSSLSAQNTINGTVYHDQNGNGKPDSGEPGISNVMVSNGRGIVSTDDNGRYEISADDNSVIFVIKPGGWTTTVDENNIPRFYRILSSSGAGGTNYDGLDPTGSSPETVNFALYPQEESNRFRVLVFGDTQPRTLDEVNYIAHDSVQEVIGIDAAFGVTLGDLVFDDLGIHKEINEVVGQIGIPWRHVIGNHDIDYSADTNWDVRGAYMRSYGPSWYAFTWGTTHFVAVDDIRWIVEKDSEGEEERYYRTGLGDDQMKFIENFLNEVPDDELVVFMMHIPWIHSTEWADESEREELFKLLASQPKAISLAAHTHRHYHDFIDGEFGWPGEEPHHLVSMGAVCGSWWTGAPDEYGIPHTLMRDGTPTGYAFLDINGNDWKLRYKAARRPADFQMHISAPDEISTSDSSRTDVFANIFNALPDARVEMRVSRGPNNYITEWQMMIPAEQTDPVYNAMKAREDSLEEVSWRRVGDANPNPRHLWQASLPSNLKPGTYTIFVRAEDEWDRYKGRRIIRVTE